MKIEFVEITGGGYYVLFHTDSTRSFHCGIQARCIVGT